MRESRRFQLSVEILDIGRRSSLYNELVALVLFIADLLCVLDVSDSELLDREIASPCDFELNRQSRGGALKAPATVMRCQPEKLGHRTLRANRPK